MSERRSSSSSPRSLKGNLLNARDRLGQTVLEIVARDVAAHGEEVLVTLRQQNPVAYARFVSDIVRLKERPKKDPTRQRREPRPLRMKKLLEAMDDQPIDPQNPRLPPKHVERMVKASEKLMPKTPWELSPDELRGIWDADLATWFETSWRNSRLFSQTRS
jgi:hypothetical protein